MRLDLIHSEGKGIILSPEAHDFAGKVAKQIYSLWDKRYENKEHKLHIPANFTIGEYIYLSRHSQVKHVIVQVMFVKSERPVIGTYKLPHAEEVKELRLGNDDILVHIKIGYGEGYTLDDIDLPEQYIKHTILHELTHAVDPKVQKNIPGTRFTDDPKTSYTYVPNKKSNEKSDNSTLYASQPVEVEASMYQMASMIVRHWQQRFGEKLQKKKVLDFARHANYDVFKNALPMSSIIAPKRLQIILDNPQYKRRFLNTLIHVIERDIK